MLGGEEYGRDNSAGMIACLDRSLRHLARAVALWPEFIESHYVRAKCFALLGNRDEMRRELEILSDLDRRYYAKSKDDKDFDRFRDDVEQVFRNALVVPGPFARLIAAKLEIAVQGLEWARRSRPGPPADLSKLETIDRDLNSGEQLLRGLDVDLVSLNRCVEHMLKALGTITNRAFQSHTNALLAEMKGIESKRSSSENTVQKLLAQQHATQGNWWITCGSGCLMYFMAMFAVVGASQLQGVIGRQLTGIANLLALGLGVAGCVAGYLLSRQHQVQAFRPQIDAAGREFQECDQMLPSVRQRAAKLQRDISAFASWQRESSSGSQPAGQIGTGSGQHPG